MIGQSQLRPGPRFCINCCCRAYGLADLRYADTEVFSGPCCSAGSQLYNNFRIVDMVENAKKLFISNLPGVCWDADRRLLDRKAKHFTDGFLCAANQRAMK